MQDQNPEKSYKRIKKLGQGSFGEAFLVENSESKEMSVCKEMKLNALTVSLLG